MSDPVYAPFMLSIMLHGGVSCLHGFVGVGSWKMVRSGGEQSAFVLDVLQAGTSDTHQPWQSLIEGWSVRMDIQLGHGAQLMGYIDGRWSCRSCKALWGSLRVSR